MTSVLIVGGTGLLGDELIRQAAASTTISSVHATWRVTTPEPTTGFEQVHWHQLDITDAAAVADLIGRLQPDQVFNVAYAKSGPQLEAVTGVAPKYLAEACQNAGSRLVQLSTDVVFDGLAAEPYHEHSPTNPINAYGRAKVIAEQAVLRLGALVARSSIIYGGHRPEPQLMLLEQATAGRDIKFFTDEIRNPVHVTDLAAALLEYAGLDDPPPILHLAGADTVDRLVFAKLLGASLGFDPSMIKGALSPADSDRPKNVPTDIGLAQQLLTTKLRGVHECLGTTG